MDCLKVVISSVAQRLADLLLSARDIPGNRLEAGPDQLVPGYAVDLARPRIRVEDDFALGLEHDDRVVCRLEDPAVASLAFAQGRLSPAARRHVHRRPDIALLARAVGLRNPVHLEPSVLAVRPQNPAFELERLPRTHGRAERHQDALPILGMDPVHPLCRDRPAVVLAVEGPERCAQERQLPLPIDGPDNKRSGISNRPELAGHLRA